MFRALDSTTNAEIIILDIEDDVIEVMRLNARNDLMHCPVCNQPVSVKAGQIKRHHFAHKHLANCPSSHDSPELLEGRAVLYSWLKSKFAEGVTLEKQIEGQELPRPLDCWVEFKGRKFAYWIIEHGMKSHDREILRNAATAARAELNIIFLARMMRRNEAPQGILNLTTTEREFLRHSDYDAIYLTLNQSGLGVSLHYLDFEKKVLMTFRAMACTEPPQQYRGTEISTPLNELKVSPKTGEFVHPTERENLKKHLAALEEWEKHRVKEMSERKVDPYEPRMADGERLTPEEWLQSMGESPPLRQPTKSREPPLVSLEPNREVICKICGRRTRDWVSCDGNTGFGKCKECSQKADHANQG